MSRKHIIVVEDERDILDVLSYNLRREGFDVTASEDGMEGLDIIQKHLPDLVLLDLMLPGMDGLDICRQLKSDSRTRHIPIIMVTARGEEVDVVLGLGIGADDYISNPFSPRELIARVKAMLRRSADTEPAAKKTGSQNWSLPIPGLALAPSSSGYLSGFAGSTRQDPGNWAARAWACR